MNWLNYLTDAMTGAAPSQQELMMREMAKKGLLQQSSMGLTPEELNLLRQRSGAAATPSEIQAIQNERLRRESGAAVTPAELQGSTMRVTPEMIRNMTPPISGQGAMADQYRQNLLRPGLTMQQNYIDPRLIEMMYYRGLLNQ